MQRLFVGIELPEKVRAVVDKAKAQLEPKLKSAKWVRRENLHLTVKFLGYRPEETVPETKAALTEAVAACRTFSVEITDFGAFPSLKRARILWLGVRPDPRLQRLYEGIDKALEGLGLEPEKRAFKPHITVARIKRPELIDLQGVEGPVGAAPLLLEIKEVTLFLSRLSPKGAEYERLARIELPAGDS
jgi:RNA 2',3'-cyclic 3'-phosphodiesterase